MSFGQQSAFPYVFWTVEYFSMRVFATFRTSFELLNVGRAVARSRGRSGCGRDLPLGHVGDKMANKARTSEIRT